MPLTCAESCNQHRRVEVTELEVLSTKFAQQLHSSVDVGMRENTAYVRNMVSGGKAGEEKCGILKNKTDKIFEVLFALPTDSSFRGSAWVIDPPTTLLPLLLYILQILRTIGYYLISGPSFITSEFYRV